MMHPPPPLPLQRRPEQMATLRSFQAHIIANAFSRRTILPLLVVSYFSVCVVLNCLNLHYQTTRTAQALMPADWAAAQAPVDYLIVSIFWSLAGVFVLFGIGLTGLVYLGVSLMPAPAAKSSLARLRLWALWTIKALLFVYSSSAIVRVIGMPCVVDVLAGANWGLLWPALHSGGRFISDSRVDGKGDLVGSELCIGDACSHRIEKIIHQTYIIANLTTWPESWRGTPSAWKKKHPDWEYKFWTDESARAFIQAEYPWFLSHFDGYKFPIQRADAIRYFALYHYGGLYADLDLQPLHALDKYLVDTDVALVETPNGGLTNMIIASRKGSPFMKCVAAKLASYQWQVHHVFEPFAAWRILTGTGPAYLWAMTSHALCGHNFVRHNEKLRIISGEATGRCSLCGGTAMQNCAANGLLKHIQGSSWHESANGVSIKTGTSIMNFIVLCHPGVVAGLIMALAITSSIMKTVFGPLISRSQVHVNSHRRLSQLMARFRGQADRVMQVILILMFHYCQLFATSFACRQLLIHVIWGCAAMTFGTLCRRISHGR